MNEITEENNPELWRSLSRQWEREKQPGYVVTRTTTYQVVQKTDGSITFRPHNAQELYETTSF